MAMAKWQFARAVAMAMAIWQNGKMAKWQNGKMAKWAMAIAKWQNGKMAKWQW